MIELRGVTVFDKKSILINNIDLKLNNGKIYGICAKGAVRSLFSALLCGARIPCVGEVLINGFDTSRESKKAKSFLACVPDEHLLYSSMTSLEYLLFIADVFGMDYQKSVRKISDALDFAELSSKRNILIANLSSYEKRRLALSQALLSPGDIYVMDAPFQGLTASQKEHFKEILEDALEGNTAILLDASEGELLSLCDTVYTFCDQKFILNGERGAKAPKENERKEEND